jgi:flavin reductase (DIM6/NTAB) family NADH-FMN oxidoreductase RutF
VSEPSRDPVRRVLRALTHGVYVLGVNGGQQAEGPRDDYVIVSLVMQCSVEPARVAFALALRSRVLATVRQARGCTLALLDVAQRAAVKRYGAPGGVRGAPEAPHRSAMGGHPVAPEGAGWLALSMVQELAVGDHVLVVADVVEAGGAITLGDVPPSFAAMTLGASGLPYAG